MTVRIGVVADTHGQVPARAHEVLAGVDRIVHAGDVGSAAVLAELEAIAPVHAVAGNMDPGNLRLPALLTLTVEGLTIRVGHVRERLPIDGADVVVTGHTHIPRVERVGDVLFVNPGALSSRYRSGDSPTAAMLIITARRAEAEIVRI